MSYSVFIPRCTHLKTNGTQCGSPAVRGRRFCFFHKNWRGQRIPLNAPPAPGSTFDMPMLEDADSIQVALMQVMQLILSGQIEPKTAGLLLYALQTASLNLRSTKLEPLPRETIVIDPGSVGDIGLGADVWDESEFEASDDEDEEDEEEEEEDDKKDSEEEEDDEDDDEDGGGETYYVNEKKQAGTEHAGKSHARVATGQCGAGTPARCRRFRLRGSVVPEAFRTICLRQSRNPNKRRGPTPAQTARWSEAPSESRMVG